MRYNLYDLNYERLSAELLRELRGKRSQAALARQLGYRANVAHTWERGIRFPPAQVLFRLAVLNRRPLQPLAEFAGCALSAEWAKGNRGASATAAFLRALAGEAPLVELARSGGVDRSTVSRWMRGTTEPRIPELLRLIDAASHRLVEFIALLVDPDSLGTLRALSRDLLAQRRMAYSLPWSHAVLRALELDAYKSLPAHVPGVVAQAIGVDLDTEQVLLAELRAARLIRRQRGKWVLARVLTVDTRTHPEGDRRLKEHWAEVALDRLRRAGRPSQALHSYNLFSVSHADFSRIRELHIEYFERVRRIIAESTVAERVVLTRQELIPLDELGPASERAAGSTG